MFPLPLWNLKTYKINIYYFLQHIDIILIETYIEEPSAEELYNFWTGWTLPSGRAIILLAGHSFRQQAPVPLFGEQH
jgi:hypothetical protein